MNSTRNILYDDQNLHNFMTTSVIRKCSYCTKTLWTLAEDRNANRMLSSDRQLRWPHSKGVLVFAWNWSKSPCKRGILTALIFKREQAEVNSEIFHDKTFVITYHAVILVLNLRFWRWLVSSGILLLLHNQTFANAFQISFAKYDFEMNDFDRRPPLFCRRFLSTTLYTPPQSHDSGNFKAWNPVLHVMVV